MDSEDEVLGISVPEAARRLGCSVSHIWRLANSEPAFPEFHHVGRSVRLDPRKLRAWFDGQRVAKRAKGAKRH